MTRLILASTSRYRQTLLARLRLPFDACRPDADETSLPGEAPAALARRLAQAKAESVARTLIGKDAWVLGSDQVADLDGVPLGKPGGREAARTQLRAMSGRQVHFHTAISLVHPQGRRFQHLDLTTVHVRPLGDTEIDRYLDAEQPYDCAGSFKSEGLGITLFAAIDNQEPTALIGLPLIATAHLLRQAGFQLP